MSVVGIWIEVIASLSFVASTLNDVIQVRYHAGGQERLAMVIEVDAPRIAGAMGKHFEHMLCWVIAPDTGVNRYALIVRCARLTDSRVREHAMATLQPSIRSPYKRVKRLMRVLESPAIQQNFGLAISHVVVIGIGQEHQVRCGTHPHATKAYFHNR